MKNLILFLILFQSVQSFGALKYSPNGPTDIDVSQLRQKTDGIFSSMKGVGGIGTTACEEKSGTLFSKLSKAQVATSLFVQCIEVSTETKAADSAFKTLFPVGQKINNVFIVPNYVGKMTNQ